MTLQEKLDSLKNLLDAGVITEEQYNSMAASARAMESSESEEVSAGDEGQEEGAGTREEAGANINLTPALERYIQSAVDRATNKLGNENKRLRKQLEEKLTDEELHSMTLQEKEAAIAERE